MRLFPRKKEKKKKKRERERGRNAKERGVRTMMPRRCPFIDELGSYLFSPERKERMGTTMGMEAKKRMACCMQKITSASSLLLLLLLHAYCEDTIEKKRRIGR